MKKILFFLAFTVWGVNLPANGLSFGSTRAMQGWTDQNIDFKDLKFQIISVHVQNTNQTTAAFLNGAFLAGWKLHTHYMHGDFLVFLFLRD